MKVLHLATWKTGGAGIAAIRLSSSLSRLGVESYVAHMESKLPAYVDAAISKLHQPVNPIFHSYNYFGLSLNLLLEKYQVDILHIHWIGAGFIRPESIAKLNLPVIWTLHDLWPLCGAEHLPNSLTRFQKGYSAKNRPTGENGLDLDRYVWERKRRAWGKANITFVAPSHYVEKLASTSPLIKLSRLTYIPNGIDTSIFKPAGAKPTKPTILFVANNPELDSNKGYSEFKSAISLLPEKLRTNIEIKVVSGGIDSDKALSSLYQSATLTVVPSKIETLSYVTMESLACGTPVVAFRVGGIPDLIKSGRSGYLAKPGDVRDLTKGIVTLLESPQKLQQFGRTGRSDITKTFDINKIAKQYLDLYRKV